MVIHNKPLIIKVENNIVSLRYPEDQITKKSYFQGRNRWFTTLIIETVALLVASLILIMGNYSSGDIFWVVLILLYTIFAHYGYSQTIKLKN